MTQTGATGISTTSGGIQRETQPTSATRAPQIRVTAVQPTLPTHTQATLPPHTDTRPTPPSFSTLDYLYNYTEATQTPSQTQTWKSVQTASSFPVSKRSTIAGSVTWVVGWREHERFADTPATKTL